MSTGKLSEKGKALEEGFFHNVDRDLISKLREQMETQEKRSFLSHVTGVTDPNVIDKLIEISIEAETITAFTLYPLVAVAWADGNIDDRERDAIMKAASEGSRAANDVSTELLRAWLSTKPADKLFTIWQQYVTALCEMLNDQQIAELKSETLDHARSVAMAAGGILGLGSKISASEQAVLDELSESFPS